LLKDAVLRGINQVKMTRSVVTAGFHLLAALLLTSCGDVRNPYSKRDEIARRTQCKYNLRELGKRVVMFERSHGYLPESISTLGGPELTCPSAAYGRPTQQTDPKYIWDPSTRTISEKSGNHDAERLGIGGMSNVTNIIRIEGTNVTH
jgi:hypothetical protein